MKAKFGVCCYCQSTHKVRRLTTGHDDEGTYDLWVMEEHNFAGKPCDGEGTVPQVVLPETVAKS